MCTTMKLFTKSETKIIAIIFVILFIIIGFNMKISLRKGRDNTRKDDLSALQKALDTFQNKYNMFPPSIEGKIGGCFGSDTTIDPKTGRLINLIACEWGKDGFENISILPRDPNFQKSASYLYLSNTDKYQIYVSLEGKSEAEYSESVFNKNLQCGTVICNYGREY